MRHAIELSSFLVDDITLKQPEVDMVLHDNNVLEVKNAYGDGEVDLYGENAVSLTENVLEALQKLEKSNKQTPES